MTIEENHAVWTPGQKDEIDKINGRLDRIENFLKVVALQSEMLLEQNKAIIQHLGIPNPVPAAPTKWDFGHLSQQ